MPIPERFLEAARRGAEARTKAQALKEQQERESAELQTREAERWVQEQLEDVIEACFKQGQHCIVLDNDTVERWKCQVGPGGLAYPRIDMTNIACALHAVGIGTGRMSASDRGNSYYFTIPLGQFTAVEQLRDLGGYHTTEENT